MTDRKHMVLILEDKTGGEYHTIVITDENGAYFANSPIPDYESCFTYLCGTGKLKLAKWLLSRRPNIDISPYAFREACYYGHLEVAQWLYSIKPTIDISCENESPFRSACWNGHLEVAQWLYSIKSTIDISAMNEMVFHICCDRGLVDVIQWLCTIRPYHYIINNADLKKSKVRPEKERKWLEKRSFFIAHRRENNYNKIKLLPDDIFRTVCEFM